MSSFRWASCLLLCLGAGRAATFGTVVPIIGGASDLVLDEPRARLYLVNTSRNQVEVYSTAQRRLMNPIPTDGTPLAAAISRSGKFLYVASRDASVLDVIDLNALNVVSRVQLPAQPEGVAVGADERVLISTIGSGAGNASNILLIFDPSAQGSTALSPVTVTPPAPLSPNLPAPSGKVFLGARSRLQASPDGNIIIGVNIPANNFRSVFVYEAASGTVLRSRLVSNSSGVLAVAPDNSKFMSGSTLFDTATLQVLAQENLANSPYLITAGTQFNTETNQGGSVFSPDGTILYGAFDIVPLTNPASRPNISQLIFNDPDNLLIQMALQLPENLSGKLVIGTDAQNIYALSESGFVAIPIGTTFRNPIAVPEKSVVLLSNDQCGVVASQRTARVAVNNMGTGRMTVSAQLLQTTPNGPGGLGGGFIGGGPGGGIIGGGGIFIILPPIVIGGGGTGTPAAVSITQNAPAVRTTQTGSGGMFDFTFNALAARALGTISPSHDFDIQSPEAINIPPRVRVYQNNRNAEAQGEIIPIPVGISANEALEDLIYDATRQRLYIANSGMNRVEVFDIRQHKFLDGIKVGQLPRSMAMTPDAGTLYVANSGGENISVVDLDQLTMTGRVKFPPTPLFVNQALSTPGAIAAGLRGPLFLMNVAGANGTSTATIWQIVGDTALPRGPSQVIGTTNGLPKTVAGPVSLAATPGGEYVVVAGGDGSTYLYDALADDFVQARTLTSFQQSQGLGYYGPITAGPKGQYFVVNGMVLNQALDPINRTAAGTTSRPIAAVAQVNATSFLRFTQPIRTAATQLASDAGQFEIVDANTALPARLPVSALEGPLSQGTTNGRATAISGRTVAVDSSGAMVYAVSTSGLSIIPLSAPSPASLPRVNAKGAVNLTSGLAAVAPNSLLSIYGANMASTGQATNTPLPTMLGGTCVTLNNNPLPLFYASSGQINAQIPPELAAGTYPLVVHSVANKAASATQNITVSKYAPAVFVDPVSHQAAILHRDGSYVNTDHPAERDEPLQLYASGLGPTTGGKAASGVASPSSPLAIVPGVELFFGDPKFSQAGIIVDFAGLAPGFVGLYQLNIRVPGNHLKGDALPVTLKVGGISSPSTGPAVAVVAVQ